MRATARESSTHTMTRGWISNPENAGVCDVEHQELSYSIEGEIETNGYTHSDQGEDAICGPTATFQGCTLEDYVCASPDTH